MNVAKYNIPLPSDFSNKIDRRRVLAVVTAIAAELLNCSIASVVNMRERRREPVRMKKRWNTLQNDK